MGRGPTKKYHKKMMPGYVKGTLTCLEASTIKKRIRPDFPLVLNIEPTNNCNLSCAVCPRSRSGRQVGYIKFSLFKKIIDEAAGYGKLLMLNLHKDGEPLLHPELPEMIAYAKKKKVARTIHLNTNGLLLSSEKIKEIIDSGIDDITISVDAFSAETFRRLKGKDLLGKVEENIRAYFRTKKKHAPPWTRVKIMEFGPTKDEIEPFIKKWEKIADETQVTGIHNWSGGIDVPPTDEISFIKDKQRFPCIFLWYMLVVNWDGKVGLCSVDWKNSYVAGDANKEPLHRVWQSGKMKQIRQAHLRGEFAYAPICRDCVVWGGGSDMTQYLRQRKDFL
jgi:radical SAM protein with 4Fe4S-binding SPASM domain